MTSLGQRQTWCTMLVLLLLFHGLSYFLVIFVNTLISIFSIQRTFFTMCAVSFFQNSTSVVEGYLHVVVQWKSPDPFTCFSYLIVSFVLASFIQNPANKSVIITASGTEIRGGGGAEHHHFRSLGAELLQ